jgi:Flp pilus assembly protein TadB
MSAPTELVAMVGAAGAVVLLMPLPRPSPATGPDGSRPAGETRAGRDDRLVLRSVATVAVALGALFFIGGWAGLAAGTVTAGLCWWTTGRLEPTSVRRRRERLAASVPHAVDLMAACLAAGLSPAAALEQITAAVDAPLCEELAAVSARLRLGVDPATVWRDLAGHPQLGGLGRTVSRAAESGASVAEAMLRLADDLRRRGRAEVESRARAVGVKAALPLGICLLPAFVLVGVVPLVAGSVSVLVQR